MATVVTTLRGSESNQGLSRSSNVVTVTRAASPTMTILVGDTVVISGVTPSSFNGTFTVTGVTGTTSFTYAQTDSDESSTVHGTTGGDYSLMSTWESTEQTNLVTDGDTHELHCYSDWPSGLNDKASVVDWTTGSANYITIKAASGHEHKGVLGDGFYTSQSGANSTGLSISQSYTKIYDIEIRNTSSDTIKEGIYIGQANCELKNVIVKNINSATVCTGLNIASAANNTSVINCIILSPKIAFRSAASTGGVVWYNCIGDATLSGQTGNAFDNNGASVTIKNCVGIGGASNAFDGTFSGSNNASDDSSAPGTNSVTGITSADFADYANDDYSPASGSDLIDAGTDLSGIFTDDIAGDIRSSIKFGIGAYWVYFPTVNDGQFFVPPKHVRAPELLIPGRKPTTGPVQIDWTHPLTKGLSHCIIFNTPTPFDLVTGKLLEVHGDSKNTAGDQCFDEAGDYLIFPDLTLNSDFTIVAHPIFTDNVGALFQYFISYGTYNTANSFQWYVVESSYGANSDDMFAFLCNSSFQNQIVDYYLNYKNLPIAFTASNTTVNQYVNGIDVDNGVAATASMSDGTTKDLYIGGRSDLNADRFFGGCLKYIMIYGDTALQPMKIMSLHRDPYQILKPSGT